jgi:hypothetical protein
MNDSASVRLFRLSPNGIECDEEGLRVGDVALLAPSSGMRTEKGFRGLSKIANSLGRTNLFVVCDPHGTARL